MTRKSCADPVIGNFAEKAWFSTIRIIIGAWNPRRRRISFSSPSYQRKNRPDIRRALVSAAQLGKLHRHVNTICGYRRELGKGNISADPV